MIGFFINHKVHKGFSLRTLRGLTLSLVFLSEPVGRYYFVPLVVKEQEKWFIFVSKSKQS